MLLFKNMKEKEKKKEGNSLQVSQRNELHKLQHARAQTRTFQ